MRQALYGNCPPWPGGGGHMFLGILALVFTGGWGLAGAAQKDEGDLTVVRTP